MSTSRSFFSLWGALLCVIALLYPTQGWGERRPSRKGPVTYELPSESLLKAPRGMCGLVRGKWIPGRLDKKGRFVPQRNSVQQLQKKVRVASQKEKGALTKKLRKAKKKLQNRQRECRAIAVAAAPAPSATPTAADIVILKDQILDLEKKGILPVLDRSKDRIGPDANVNGIRDDIDSHIAAMPLTEPQKKSVEQLARGLQNILTIDLTNDQALERASEINGRAIHCIAIRQPGRVPEIASHMEKVTFNTKERALWYIQYNKKRSGSFGTIPNGDTCEN